MKASLLEKQIRQKLKTASRDELIVIIEMLLPLITRVEELEREVAELKGRNSKNSSHPPSQDIFKPKPKSLRKKTGKKSGGQKGHKGTNLDFFTQIENTIEYYSDSCLYCGHDLSNQTQKLVERKQVVDVPVMSYFVTQHQRYSSCCPDCKELSCAQFPAQLTKGASVRYGANLSNLITYLSTRQLLPLKRLAETIDVLFGLPISQGTIENMLNRKVLEVQDVYDTILNRIQSSQVIGVDESGCKVNGKKSWVWTWVTEKFSLFDISDNRGKATIERMFPNGYRNAILVSDCWKPHLNSPAKNHQICIPHLRRECEKFSSFYRSKWAAKLDKVLYSIQLLCQKKRIPLESKKQVENKLDRLLANQLKGADKKIITFRDRLRRLKEYITLCLYNRKVPPDNNFSERSIRMAKLKQKISGCFRSWKGAKRFAILRTIVDTAIKQNIHPLVAIRNPKTIL